MNEMMNGWMKQWKKMNERTNGPIKNEFIRRELKQHSL